MLEITVKTLDGRNRTFDVDDNITVKQFKETIASSIEIEAEVQRLIYRGKVLIDDKKINDYDVNGKTLHVVQRAPPQVNQPGTSTAGQSSSRTNVRSNGFEIPEGLPQGIHIEMIPENEGSTQAPHSESRKRINQAAKMLNLAKEVVNGLEASLNDDTPTEETMEVDEGSTSQESSEEQQEKQPQQQPPQQEEVQGTQQRQAEEITDPPTSALADLLDEVLRMNERMEGHIKQYRDLMRNSVESAQDTQSLESVCQGTSRAMHLMSHVYHNLSDLFCDFESPAPRRLRAFSPPMRQATTIIQQTIPVQVSAQFNVSPVLRENLTTTTSSSGTTPTPPPSTSTSANASTSSATLSSSTPPFNTIISELNRIIGGEVPNFQFSSPGSGATTTTNSRSSPATATMFMEMGPNGSMTVVPEQGNPAPTSTASTTPSPAAAPATESSGRTANVTVSSSGGNAPGFLNDDFIQNIIQVATGVALQNGGAQRPQFVMLGPQLAFMGSGQRGQPSTQRRRARRAGDTSSQAPTTAVEGATPSNAGSPRAENARGLTEVTIDPCLPCNSWHFGHRRHPPPVQEAPQNESTQGQANGSATRTTTSSTSAPPPLSNFPHFQNMMGMVQDFFTSLTRTSPRGSQSQTNQTTPPSNDFFAFPRMFDPSSQRNSTLENILNNLGAEQSPNEGLLSEAISALAPHITFSDLFNFILGQSSSLSRIRVPLQDFVRNNLLAQGPPTEENVAAAAERIVNSLQPDIQEITDSVQVNEDIDFAASVRSYLKFQFEIIIKLIIDATEDAEFADQLFSSMTSLLYGLVNLCRHCLRDGDRAIEAIIQNRIRSMYAEVSPNVTPFMSQWMVQFLHMRLPGVPRNQESFIGHVIRRSAGEQPVTTPRVEREVDIESSGSYATVHEEVMEEEPVPPMVNGVPGEETFVPVEGHHPRLSDDVLARLPSPPMDDSIEFEAELEKGDQDNSWKNVVPKEWVPVIAKDAVRQRRQAMDCLKEPISDAYMCGIPAKRRRIMKDRNAQGTAAPGSTHVNNLAESIRQAANQVNCQPITSFQDVRADLETSHNLLSAYREELARSSEAPKEKFEADQKQ